MSEPTIVFMGTPAFALPALSGLVREGYPVIGVVTQPDRPAGRGRILEPSPVKLFALQKGLPALQPEKVRHPDFLAVLRRLSPALVVVAAFGQILPREILEIPPLGCINIHPSLLPRYRGAAPIPWTIIRGETRTGVTVMRMDEGMDSGDILLQEETTVGPEEICQELHDRLALRGAELLLQAIPRILDGSLPGSPQDHAAATFAPMLRKEDGRLCWENRVADIVSRIRGLSPSPGAYTLFSGRKLRIFRASGRAGGGGVPPGTIGKPGTDGLPVAAGDGTVCLREVQLESKNRMPIEAFLRGFRILPGSRFD